MRISFTRRSSLFSFSSSFSRARSSVVSPGRSPWSTSARRTHERRVSAVIPSLEAIAVMADHSVEVLVTVLDEELDRSLTHLGRTGGLLGLLHPLK